MKLTLLLILVALILSGCATEIIPVAKPTAPVTDLKPIQDAAAKVAEASKRAEQAEADFKAKATQIASQIRANVDASRTENQKNPDGAPKFFVDSELGLVQTRLADVPPDPAEQAASAQRQLLVESGKTEEARAAYGNAAKQADELTKAIAASKASEAQAIADRDAARASEAQAQTKFAATLAQNKLDNQKVIDQLVAKQQAELDSIRKGWIHQQIIYLNLAGAAGVIIFGLAVGFGGFAGLRAGAPIGVMGLVCFGLAQIVAQPWFMWAVLGGGVIAAIAVGWWIYDHWKQNTLKQAAQTQVANLSGTLQKVVPVLDTAYESTSQEVKKVLDDQVFDPLSKSMGSAEKSVIHLVRATNLTPTPIATTAIVSQIPVAQK